MDMHFVCSPLLPFLLTWNPPCCDRIRPPSSQVARKLTSPFPHLAHIPSHPKSRPPPGFSRSKYTLIRTTLQTQPISSQTIPPLWSLQYYIPILRLKIRQILSLKKFDLHDITFFKASRNIYMLYTIHEDTKALRNKRNKMKFTCGKEHLTCEDQNSSENDLEQDNNLSEATTFFRRTPRRHFSYYLFFLS